MPREWSITPIEKSISNLEYNKFVGEDMKNYIDHLSQYPFQGKDRKDMKFMTAFKDGKTQEYVSGMMSVGQATWEAMAREYPRGYLASNIAHMKEVSISMMPSTAPGQDPYDYTKYDYEGSLLAYTPEQKQLIDAFASGTEWNVIKLAEGRNPVDLTTGTSIETFLSTKTPEDLWTDPPPDGWNVKEALEQLQEINPHGYKTYETILGGEERMYALAVDSRNAPELFYKLNNELQLQAINMSIARNYEEMNAGEEFWEQWVKGLLINGIANDPDLPASI